jgi:general secretion pathway protein D
VAAVGATTAGSVSPVTLAVVPPAVTQAVGSTFQVALTVANAHDLASIPVQLHFDPKVLSLVNVDAGELLARGGQVPAVIHRDEGNGNVTISASRPSNVQGVDGQGTVCTLTFKALSSGDSTLSLLRIGAKDSKQNILPAVGAQSVVHVK